MDPGHVVPEVDHVDLSFRQPQGFQCLLEFFMKDAAFAPGHDETVDAFGGHHFLDPIQPRTETRKRQGLNMPHTGGFIQQPGQNGVVNPGGNAGPALTEENPEAGGRR
jgi:hypothetical protein